MPTISHAYHVTVLLALISWVGLPIAVESWSLHPGSPSKSKIGFGAPLISSLQKRQSAKSSPQIPPVAKSGKSDAQQRPYIPAPPRFHMPFEDGNDEDVILMPQRNNALVKSATAASINLLTSLVPKDTRASSNTAAKIEINNLPPDSIQLDFRDIPLVGGILSGTWVKVAPPLPKGRPSSIVIESPTDKFGAVKNFLDRGRLEFHVEGLLNTLLDVDVEPNQRGDATVKFSSKLIPKLTFGSRKSNWNRITNMGNGERYYFNSVTGEAQYEDPEEF